MDTETAVGVVEKMTDELGLFAVWEKWNAYVERPLGDLSKSNLPNPFTRGAA